MFVGDLYIAKAKFCQAVFYEALFLYREVAARLFLQHAKEIDRVPGQWQIGLEVFFLVSQLQQPELHLGLHENGFDQKFKAGRRYRKILRSGAAVCHTTFLFYFEGKVLMRSRYIRSEARRLTKQSQEAGEKFAELVEIMAKLRAPGGCPWDRKQNFDTIKSYLLEETYEVMDAIDSGDWDGLVVELGDLLLQPVFFAEMAREQGLFAISDALDAINQKLVRRHPHVFGDVVAETAEDVKHRWDEIKRQEKAEKGALESASMLDCVPRTLPALVEAEKIGHKVAKVGFEWPDVSGVVEKLQEEAAELAQAWSENDYGQIEHEIGDLLFNVVNLARYLKVDPEQALRKTNARFRTRFAHLEREAAARSWDLKATPLNRKEELWQEAKQLEKNAHGR